MRVQTRYNINDVFYYIKPVLEDRTFTGYQLAEKKCTNIKTESKKIQKGNNLYSLVTKIYYIFDDKTSVDESVIDEELFFSKADAMKQLEKLKWRQ